MHAVRRARRGLEAEAAVEQRVVGLEAVARPCFLGVRAAAVAGQFHPRRRGHGPVAHAELDAPVVVVRQFKEVRLEHRHDGDGPRPVVLLQINQPALRVRPLGHAPQREHRHVEPLLVPEDEERAERVGLPAGAEDFVFRVAREPDVRRVHDHGLRAEVALHVPVAKRGRHRVHRGPVNHRQRDVHVLGEHRGRQLGGRAVVVGVAAEPAALGHVDPALERQFHLDRLGRDGELVRQRQILLPALDERGVAARRQLRDPLVSRERGVILGGVRVEPAALLVAHGGTERRHGLGEMPLPVRVTAQVEPRSDGLAGGRVRDVAIDGDSLRDGKASGAREE